MFSIYLKLGFQHLLDLSAYDHILFIVALAIVYRPSEWKKILLLVTAFTIGHSITLALAALDVIAFPSTIIEWLIPITILITAFSNIYRPQRMLDPDKGLFEQNQRRNYFFALFFGLIHGMGFSNFLKSSIMPGEASQLVVQLLAFNLGIEIGQILLVAVVLAVSYLVLDIFRMRHQMWVKTVSWIVVVMTGMVMYNLWNG